MYIQYSMYYQSVNEGTAGHPLQCIPLSHCLSIHLRQARHHSLQG